MSKLKNEKIEILSTVVAIVGVFLPRSSFRMDDFDRVFFNGHDFIIDMFRLPRHEGFIEWISDSFSHSPFNFFMYWLDYIAYTIAILLLIIYLIILLKAYSQYETGEVQKRSRYGLYALILLIISGITFIMSWIHHSLIIDDWPQFMSSRLSIGYFITLISAGLPVILNLDLPFRKSDS